MQIGVGQVRPYSREGKRLEGWRCGSEGCLGDGCLANGGGGTSGGVAEGGRGGGRSRTAVRLQALLNAGYRSGVGWRSGDVVKAESFGQRPNNVFGEREVWAVRGGV